jgi:hypothetical protein
MGLLMCTAKQIEQQNKLWLDHIYGLSIPSIEQSVNHPLTVFCQSFSSNLWAFLMSFYCLFFNRKKTLCLFNDLFFCVWTIFHGLTFGITGKAESNLKPPTSCFPLKLFTRICFLLFIHIFF